MLTRLKAFGVDSELFDLLSTASSSGRTLEESSSSLSEHQEAKINRSRVGQLGPVPIFCESLTGRAGNA
jgi:hypothetical protein